MTGSGMGCPDWPKCFGFLIPPTERSQLEWKPNSEYNKNQIIIIDKNLYYSVKSFNSKEDFNKSNWNKYTKHDYSKFNVYHTWIELLIIPLKLKSMSKYFWEYELALLAWILLRLKIK